MHAHYSVNTECKKKIYYNILLRIYSALVKFKSF